MQEYSKEIVNITKNEQELFKRVFKFESYIYKFNQSCRLNESDIAVVTPSFKM